MYKLTKSNFRGEVYMRRLGIFVFAAVILTLASCGGSKGKILAEVNGSEITEGDLKFLSEINPRIQAQIADPAGQRKIVDNLVEQDLFYQEALKRGINRDPLVKEKVDLYRRVIIAQSLLDAEANEAAKKYYDEHQDEFKKLKLSDIMVKYASPDEIKKAKKGEKLRTEQEALKIAAVAKSRIDAGESFSKVAGGTTDDPVSKARGGDLGPVSKGDKRMEARGMGAVIDKAFEMKVGEAAGPIKTDKAYHIITVTEAVELEPFETAKQGILFRVKNETKDKLLAHLKKNAKIIYPEDEKKKAEAKKKVEETKKAEADVKPPETSSTAPTAQPPAETPKAEEKK